MFDKRLLENIDWWLLGVVLVIAAIGVINLRSASAGFHPTLYRTQLGWVGLGLAVSLIVAAIDYRTLMRGAPALFLVATGLLVVVLLFGRAVMGARRWIDLGIFRMQPSELVKIAVVALLARHFHDDIHPRPYTFRELILPLLIVAVPAALILPQPDLGTAGLLVLIGGSLLLFIHIDWRLLLILAAVGIGFVVIAWFFGLEDYQRQRISNFVEPTRDVLGSGYHARQSIIAIGSGGLVGKGYHAGSQSQLAFLPEQHTDFIFSVFAEEWGFVGSGLLVLLYAVLLFRGIAIAVNSKEKLGTLLAVGITLMIGWHVFVNMAMVLGLLPVVGVPLPLVSYGGSGMLSTFVGVGLLMNVAMRRFIFSSP